MNKLSQIIFLMLFSYVTVFAQADTTVASNPDSLIKIVNMGNEEVKTPLLSDGQNEYFLTTKEAILSFCVLLALILVLIIEIWLIKVVKVNSDAAIKLVLVSLVIMSTLLLIMGGYSDKIVAPAFGLFGTIAGYILGKSDNGSPIHSKH